MHPSTSSGFPCQWLLPVYSKTGYEAIAIPQLHLDAMGIALLQSWAVKHIFSRLVLWLTIQIF